MWLTCWCLGVSLACAAVTDRIGAVHSAELVGGHIRGGAKAFSATSGRWSESVRGSLGPLDGPE